MTAFSLEDALSGLSKSLDCAQNELVEAETLLAEVSARAEKARTEVSRLKAAVAALSGESAPSEPPEPAKKPAKEAEAIIEDPDEWEKARAKKLREKEKQAQAEARANNPLYDVKCRGCGQSGFLQQSVITAPSGLPLSCVVCSSCGNQTFG